MSSEEVFYYTGEAAFKEYMKRFANPYNFPLSIEICPNCGDLAVQIDTGNIQTGFGAHVDTWVHAVMFPGGLECLAISKCQRDSAGIFHHYSNLTNKVVGIWGGEPESNGKQVCTCEWALVLSEGCQCGGL